MVHYQILNTKYNWLIKKKQNLFLTLKSSKSAKFPVLIQYLELILAGVVDCYTTIASSIAFVIVSRLELRYEMSQW